MNKNIEIIIKWLIGPLLAAWLFYSLYQQAMAQPDLDATLARIKALPFGAHAWKFWAVILFVFVNWGLEAAKWQLLMKVLQPISFIAAFKAVLCGVTFSLNTPNRMGEFAGRILFVDDGKRMRAVTLTVAGSLAQLIITMLMGCFALIWLLMDKQAYWVIKEVPVMWLHFFLYGSIMCTAIFMFFYFRFDWLIKWLAKLPFGSRLLKYVNILKTFDAKILLRLLYLSLLRFIIFVLQYIFMLQLLQVEQDGWVAGWLVCLMFWILAIIPSIAIAELGIRGTVAKVLFGYSSNIIGILTAAFGIWFVNLFIPAIIGSLLILSVKIKNPK